LKFAFYPYPAFFTGGVRVAVADLLGNGVDDIITTPGRGAAPLVEVFDGRNGQLILSFFAITGTPVPGAVGGSGTADIGGVVSGGVWIGGMFVAAGDILGNGKPDIVVGADAGGSPLVQIFDGRTGALVQSFVAFGAPFFTGGVRVAVGDVTGSGHADIITGAGPGGLPQVTIYDGITLGVINSYFAFPGFFTGGVYVAAGHITSAVFADVVAGAGAGGGPEVNVYSGGTSTLLAAFFATSSTFRGGVRVAVHDLNNDGRDDIITSLGPRSAPLVQAFDTATLRLLTSFFAYPTAFSGGVFVG
jgi:hypothetical protein